MKRTTKIHPQECYAEAVKLAYNLELIAFYLQFFNSPLLFTSRLKKIAGFSAPWRLAIFLGALSILWLPLAVPIYWLCRTDSNLGSILTMGLLFIELLFCWKFWGRFVHGDRHIYRRYGLVKNRKNVQEFLQGLAIGLWLCLGLFITEAMLGWILITNPSSSSFLIRIIVEGFVSALGIAFAEELLFRGWLLDELQRDYSQKICLWLTAIIFALAHFLKPIEEIIRTAVTFPALVLLGIALVLAKDKCSNCEAWRSSNRQIYTHSSETNSKSWSASSAGNRLGMSIGIHGGLVWGYYILNVGQLVEYTKKVSPWVTGIDGNPIAGLMGLVFLSGLIWIMSVDNKKIKL